MAKGENIFKRKDGRWEARYIKSYDNSRKAKYGFCYGKTYKEAKEKVERCKAALLLGKQAENKDANSCFEMNCKTWLVHQKERVKESTYIKYRTAVLNHIIPCLGECGIHQLNSQMVDNFTHMLMNEKGLSSKSTHDILVILHTIINYAVEVENGSLNPVEIRYPKVVKGEMRVLSREEQRNLIEFLLADMDFCKFGVIFALFTGLRIGELCALKWTNISMEEKAVRISASMQRLQSPDNSEKRTHIVVGTPKSKTSYRLVPLTDDLAMLCQSMNPGNPNAYLLTGTENYMEPRLMQYRFKKYAESCGLEGVHFHTLRHTFATRAVEVGFEIKSLSEILGHSSTTVTLNQYVHSSMELKRENMLKMRDMTQYLPQSNVVSE